MYRIIAGDMEKLPGTLKASSYTAPTRCLATTATLLLDASIDIRKV